MTDIRDSVVLKLFELFSTKGFDGASIGDISAVTGLGRSSLYHYFPGGKDEMARAVIALAEESIAREIIAPLHGSGAPTKRLSAMLDGAEALYAGRPCVLASLLSAEIDDALRAALASAFETWREATVQTLAEAGAADADRSATAMLALVQGGLVLARASGRRDRFTDAVEAARVFIPE